MVPLITYTRGTEKLVTIKLNHERDNCAVFIFFLFKQLKSTHAIAEITMILWGRLCNGKRFGLQALITGKNANLAIIAALTKKMQINFCNGHSQYLIVEMFC